MRVSIIKTSLKVSQAVRTSSRQVVEIPLLFSGRLGHGRSEKGIESLGENSLSIPGRGRYVSNCGSDV